MNRKEEKFVELAEIRVNRALHDLKLIGNLGNKSRYISSTQQRNKIINSIKNFFNNDTNLKVLKNLDELLEVKNVETPKVGGPLNNKTFMFTGKLSKMSRSEAKSLIEQNSGSIFSNVTKKLDYLIIGEKPTNRKVDAAKNLGVKILDQSSWLKMLK